MTQAAAQLKVGVVGLGYFGSHHARHYAAHPGARLVAVVDADPERASQSADRFGARPFGDHRALIGEVEAVSVAVPTSAHDAVAGDLIEAGIHVFVEKPIAADARAAARLVEKAERRQVTLQVGHIERYAPAFRALKERIAAPRLISCVRHARWSGRATDVDVVLDLMIHDIDLALTLAGSPVVSVAAAGARVSSRWHDMVEARLSFANGIVATLSASRVAVRPERSVSVAEEGRMLAADLSAQTLTITRAADAGAETVSLAPADNLAAEIDAFVDSVRTGTPPVVDGRAGLDAMTVADMILADLSRGRASLPSHLHGVSA